MRIHFVVRSLRQEGAGSHQNAIAYIRLLKEYGHIVTVHTLTTFNNPPGDVSIVEYDTGSFGLIKGNKFLSKLLVANEKDADLFFLYGVDCIWGGGSYRRQGGTTPVAVYLDTCLSTMGTSQRLSTTYYLKRLFWEKLFGMRDAAWVDSYIAASPFIQDIYARFGFPKNVFHVISNFFTFNPKMEPQKNDSSVPTLLYAGRLTYDKGTDLLIAAVSGIPAEIPWHLQIVGEGPIKDDCERMLREYKLESRVTILPWVTQSELRGLYQAADIFVHPSRCPEAFGRTFVEALSHGLPVIASNIGAAPWTIGQAGVFFASGDVQSLRTAIITLLTDKSFRERLGEQGVAQVQKFTKEIVGPDIELVLKNVRDMHPLSVPSSL